MSDPHHPLYVCLFPNKWTRSWFRRVTFRISSRSNFGSSCVPNLCDRRHRAYRVTSSPKCIDWSFVFLSRSRSIALQHDSSTILHISVFSRLWWLDQDHDFRLETSWRPTIDRFHESPPSWLPSCIVTVNERYISDFLLVLMKIWICQWNFHWRIFNTRLDRMTCLHRRRSHQISQWGSCWDRSSTSPIQIAST